MKLSYFNVIDFLQAIKALFKELKVPRNTYKENETFALVDDMYFVGMADDAENEARIY